MKIAVLGAGAVGSLLGALLSESGCDVTLISRRKEHVNAINGNGLRIGNPDGSEKLVEVKAETEITREPDLIILTVKAYDVESALAQVKKFRCPVLCLQNGIGVEEIAAKVISDRAIRGIIFVGATLLGPGRVLNAGIGTTFIGPSPYSEKIVESFSKSRLPAKIAEDITGMVWTKALFNCGLNAFGALTGLRNGELLDVPGLEESMLATVQEGEAVAESLGIKVDKPQEKLLRIMESTAANKNSMLQDVEAGRRTEIDFLNGAISRLGKERGVATPLNDAMTALVKGLELKCIRQKTS